jgi:hypothetical protein
MRLHHDQTQVILSVSRGLCICAGTSAMDAGAANRIAGTME